MCVCVRVCTLFTLNTIYSVRIVLSVHFPLFIFK
jgi:hypothetical protein